MNPIVLYVSIGSIYQEQRQWVDDSIGTQSAPVRSFHALGARRFCRNQDHCDIDRLSLQQLYKYTQIIDEIVPIFVSSLLQSYKLVFPLITGCKKDVPH